MTLSTTDEERQAYKDSRRAGRYVKGASATFEQWVKYGHALVAARGEAMGPASADQPSGKRYNYEINKIMMREGLVDFFYRGWTLDGKRKRRSPLPAVATRAQGTAVLIEPGAILPISTRQKPGRSLDAEFSNLRVQLLAARAVENIGASNSSRVHRGIDPVGFLSED
jgi:hypothetical protein